MAEEKKKETEQQIISVFEEHRRRYGVRRISVELKASGVEKAGIYKVRKVLKKYGLTAIQPRSFVPRTTDSRHILIRSVRTCCRQELFRQDRMRYGQVTLLTCPCQAAAFSAWHLDDNMKRHLS